MYLLFCLHPPPVDSLSSGYAHMAVSISQRERQVWIARKIKNPSGAFSGGIHLSMRNYFTISFAAAAYFSIFASTSAFSLPFAMM